ncbi:MAG TPA: DNA gyrase subunit A [Bryobacteraceae bacterium]|nr:DNA gyrase subunit A [Bryobacteraceae bacterium]
MADQEQPPQGPPAPPPAGGNLPLGGGGNGGNQNLVPTNIEDEMKRSYLDYAMSVIVGRALPDIRDGLKPVHRRILYTMQQMGLQPNRPTRKCARIVGDAMGKYHPHGNLAIYDALVRLAQPFSMRYPLVEGQGNFGSVDGDPPAADRYTEARLARVATALLEDLDKETVDFKPNYDDSETEPEVLPTRVPNLLVNGSSGIAVGMATNIPPHNLTEVINAVVHKIQHPDAPLLKLLEFVQGPDFPTGGFILGRQGILQAYTTGRGQLKIRARAKIERMSKDRDQIIIDEIPYQVNKSKLLEQIASMVNEKRIEGISDVVDHSDRDGMRIVVELKRGEQAEVVLNNLYKNTQLQIGFGIIMLSIVNGQPRELGLVDMIKFFIDHRIDVVRRRTEYELRKAREREHILLGFQKALDNLDEVIRLIRAAKQPREARESLIARFAFSEKQAQAIIELQLQRLTGMEQQKILDELADIQRRIAEYLEILGSDKVLRDLIVKELKEVQKDFGDERRTQIIEDTGEILIEDLVQMEDVAITVTRGGYLKRTSVDTYRRQMRGGKGRIGMGTRAEDMVEHLLVTSTHSYLLIFTTRGRVYWLKAYEIPDATTTGKGKHISNLINLQSDEEPRTFLPVKDFVADKFVVMVTRHAVIKKSELTEFDNPISRGLIALTLDEGDQLIGAGITNGQNYILLGSHEGQAIRFAESQVRPMGRQARGVRAMDLAEGDYLVGVEVMEKEGLVLSLGENGYGKRTPLEDYRLTNRGGKGVINMKTTKKTGNVVAILSVREDSEIVIVTQAGKIIRIEGNTIRQVGRSSQGVRLVSLDEGDQVAAASVIPDTEEPTNQEPLPLQ